MPFVLCMFVATVSTGKVRLVALLYPLALDCLGNLIIDRESFRNSMSAKAYDTNVGRQKYWSWTRGFVDTIFSFQPDHCRVQWELENHYGSVWRAWGAAWRGDEWKIPERSSHPSLQDGGSGHGS